MPLRRAGVAVMQAAQIHLADHHAILEEIDGPRNRRVAIQRQVRSGFVMVAKVFGQNASQMLLAEHDHVVQAFSAYGADQTFHVGICLHRQLHPVRTMGRERFASRIPSIRSAAGSSRW